MKGIKYYNFLGFNWSYGWHDAHLHWYYYKSLTFYKIPFIKSNGDGIIEIIFRKETEWNKLS